MAYYGYQPQQYTHDVDYLKTLVLQKLTNGLLLASVLIIIMTFIGLPSIFLFLAVIGYIVSIIGYFFARNENTINTLYFIFVGSSGIFTGAMVSLLVSVGYVDVVVGAFGGTGLVVGYLWYKASTERPDPNYVGRNLTKYSIIFIVVLLLSWFIIFSDIVMLFISIFGVALFSLYLYYDFSRVMRGQIYSPARMAWSIYWDILLIFRYMLQIMLYFASRRD